MWPIEKFESPSTLFVPSLSLQRRSESMGSQDSISSVNTISEAQFDLSPDKQVFSYTTIYKGNVVALKALPYHRVDLTNELLAEVNRVRHVPSFPLSSLPFASYPSSL